MPLASLKGISNHSDTNLEIQWKSMKSLRICFRKTILLSDLS